jgi:TetR/AcrR family transcriptional repressor of mexJK operon
MKCNLPYQSPQEDKALQDGPPRSGKREARRESRREAILDVAACSFLKHGYAGTTMSAIAGTLGGSKGTLWSYFPDKEQLFAAVLDRATAKFREDMLVTLNADDPVELALNRFCTRYIAKLTSPEAVALHRLVMGEAGRFPEVGRIFHERAPMPTKQLMADYIAAAMARGALRQADPARAAQNLFALAGAHWQQRRMAGVAEPLDLAQAAQEAADAVDVFMRAYGPAAAG